MTTAKAPMADRVVGLLARAVARAWFSDVEVEGRHRLPDGPLVVAANHANGFVDPVLLRAHLPRPVRFLAKKALWRVPIVGALLDAAGALPVERAADGDTAGNVSTFTAAHDVLRKGGTVGVFPEGDVAADGRLLPLRTGTARIALGARAAGVEGIHLVPVGLVYADQTAPRERALLRVGEPIDVDAFAAPWEAKLGGPVGEHHRPAVDALTASLRQLLGDTAVEYADRAEALALTDAAMIHQRATGASGGEARQVTLGAVGPGLRRLAAASTHERHAVVEALATYRLRLALLHLDDAAVQLGVNRGRPRGHAVVAVAVVGILSPLALPGLAVNLAPYLLVDQFAARPMARASRANFQLLASMVTFPLAWLACGLFLRRLSRRHPWRWVAAAGPLGGLAALASAERVRQIRRSRLALKALLRNPDQLPDLAALRTAVVSAVDAAFAADAPAP